jgi:hypothetical protein
MTAGLGYWASNEFFDQTTASRKFRRLFARSTTASVQHRRIQTLPKPFDLLPEPPIADPAIRATSRSTGEVPKAGFNELVPELDVSNLQASLRFWSGVLGFDVAYGRPAARFAYLVRGHIQIISS